MKKKIVPAKSSKPLKKKAEYHETSKPSVRKQIFLSLSVLGLVTLATALVVLYASGYRFVFSPGATPSVSKTGILNASSTPTSAQIYIDDHLTSATNNSINLAPNKYKIKIAKEGYNDWQKDVDIQAEQVTNVEPVLFPKAPTLQSVSTLGVESAIIDPTGTKLAFKIASQSAKKNGIYVFDMSARILPVLAGQASSQLADDTIAKFSEAKISWSPDGRELLASISATLEPTPAVLDPTIPDPTIPEIPQFSTYYLLKTDGLNETPSDVTATIEFIKETWQEQITDKEAARLKSLKKPVQEFAKKNFKILAFSPDEKKILYQASSSAEMPVFIKPRRIGNNLRYERRELKKDAIYVYNITEDVNTRIIDSIDPICRLNEPNCACVDEEKCKNPFTWLPDSTHLIYINERKIVIVEDDGANATTIYAGPFLDNYVFPWPDGSKIVILTNLGNPTVSPTLYTIGLK